MVKYKQGVWETRINQENYIFNIQYCDLVVDQKYLFKNQQKYNVDWKLQYCNYSQFSQSLHKKDSFYGILENFHRNQTIFEGVHIDQFVPKTYLLNFTDVSGIQIFQSLSYDQNQKSNDNNQNNNITANDKWIFKPGNSSQGDGIQVFQNLEDAQQFVKNKQEIVSLNKNDYQGAVIQKYIENTALLRGKKFDLRCYMFISSFDKDQELVFFQEGVIRRSLAEYDKDEVFTEDNKNSHLTNVSLQNKFADENNDKQEAALYFKQLQQYVIDELGFSQVQAEKIKINIKKIVTYIAEAYLQSIPADQRYQGQFQHYGIDIMFDQDYNAYFLEANSGPLTVIDIDVYYKVAQNFIKIMMDIQTFLIENSGERQEIIKQNKYPLGNLELLINNASGYNFLKEEIEKEKQIKDKNQNQNNQHQDL